MEEAGGFDSVGGLVGRQSGDIISSYATGEANGGGGSVRLCGRPRGQRKIAEDIISSYATGNANGGNNNSDRGRWTCGKPSISRQPPSK